MADGFEVVPDELKRAAAGIGEALRDVAGMPWQGPGGDYGHPVLGTAWADFIEEIKDQVGTFHDAALSHGEKLDAAATHYSESDIRNGQVVGNCWLPNGGVAAKEPAPFAAGIMAPRVPGLTNQEANDMGIHY